MVNQPKSPLPCLEGRGEEDEEGDAAVVASKLGVMVAAGQKGGGWRERQREAERAGDGDFAFVVGVHTRLGVVFLLLIGARFA